jgi:hypothetical protein
MAFQSFYLLSNSMSTGATPSQGGDFTVNGIDQPDRFLPGSYPSSVGTNQLVAFDNGLNPLRNQWVAGPWLTNLSASLYKTVPITERVKLRINLDAFNVLNQPGLGTPSTEGIISLRNSAQGARVLQYTGRITW